jgi:hypothetical protein
VFVSVTVSVPVVNPVTWPKSSNVTPVIYCLPLAEIDACDDVSLCSISHYPIYGP